MKKSFLLSLVSLAVLALIFTTLSTSLHASAGPTTPEYGPTPYMAMNGSSPVRWPACSTIGYKLNLTGAPADAAANVNAALALISTYTRFTFVDEGTTAYIPQENWASTNLPAALTIAWATPATSSLLGGPHELSIGDVAAVGPSGDQHYTDGVVVMDTSATSNLPSGTGSGDLGLLLLHELSHAMGLNHSHNPNSYMYPYFGVATQSVQPADLAHLSNLDTGSC